MSERNQPQSETARTADSQTTSLVTAEFDREANGDEPFRADFARSHPHYDGFVPEYTESRGYPIPLGLAAEFDRFEAWDVPESSSGGGTASSGDTQPGGLADRQTDPGTAAQSAGTAEMADAGAGAVQANRSATGGEAVVGPAARATNEMPAGEPAMSDPAATDARSASAADDGDGDDTGSGRTMTVDGVEISLPDDPETTLSADGRSVTEGYDEQGDSIDEFLHRVDDASLSPDDLRALLVYEADHKDRSGAKDGLTDRLREATTASDGGTDSDTDTDAGTEGAGEGEE